MGHGVNLSQQAPPPFNRLTSIVYMHCIKQPIRLGVYTLEWLSVLFFSCAPFPSSALARMFEHCEASLTPHGGIAVVQSPNGRAHPTP